MTAPFIPDPRGLEFPDWCAQLIINTSTEPLAIPPPESHWRDYADYLSQTAAFSSSPVPNPYHVDTWREWALDLVASLS